MVKVRGSSSAFMWGRTVHTDYSSGCLRAIYLASKGVKDTIDESHSIRGELNEDTYEQELIKQGLPYQRELTISGSLSIDPDYHFSGRIDFLVGGVVHELKSSESKSRLPAIKKGEWSTNNLAQTVAYMDQMNVTEGKLVYSYWVRDKKNGEYQKSLETPLDISIDNYGRIGVNSKPTQYTVYDLYAHQYHVIKVQRDDIIWERPHNYDLLWGSPCGYCPFKDACNKWDNEELGDSPSSFVTEAMKGIAT